MNEGDRAEMMQSMMEQLFGGMGAEEKQNMCAAMMGKMTEGLDMKEMMPKMMMGMMSGGAGPAEDRGGDGAQPHMAKMPEMMLQSMMPHCIKTMLPMIDAEKRGDVAAAIVSAIVENGPSGMSEDETKAFYAKLFANR